jgi:predicted transcriptional regulator
MDRTLLEKLVLEGKSTYAIAKITGKSQTNVRRWLKKYELKTLYREYTGVTNCCRCGVQLNDNNSYTIKSGEKAGKKQSHCRECNSKYTVEKLRKNKQKALDYKGKKCQICGYDRCNDALEFHHVDPEKKEIDPSKLRGLKWESQKIELDKCILLCANCHREVHGKIREDPDFNVYDLIPLASSSESGVEVTSEPSKL